MSSLNGATEQKEQPSAVQNRLRARIQSLPRREKPSECRNESGAHHSQSCRRGLWARLRSLEKGNLLTLVVRPAVVSTTERVLRLCKRRQDRRRTETESTPRNKRANVYVLECQCAALRVHTPTD